jgi:hypothetical protein
MPNNGLGRFFRDEGRAVFMDLADQVVAKANERGKTGEDLFRLILSGLQEVYDVPCVIAGGAVRDLAAGITTHKDVDVFLPLTWKRCAERMGELGWRVLPQFTGRSADYAKRKEGTPGTMGFTTLGRAAGNVQGVKVDLVLMDQPLSQKDVETFPVYAQRGIWTLEGGLLLSPQAKTDIENKTFTIDPTIADKGRLRKVLEKVQGWQKRSEYKGWKIVEPDVKEWWEVKAEADAAKLKQPSTTSSWYNTNDAAFEPHPWEKFLGGQKWDVKVIDNA